jgi:hypothetical protein
MLRALCNIIPVYYCTYITHLSLSTNPSNRLAHIAIHDLYYSSLVTLP